MPDNEMQKVQNIIATAHHSRNCLSCVAAAFMAGISQIGGTAQCFNSDNPINSRNWATTIATVSVIVMTAQSFLNVLQDNTTSFQDIALMVTTVVLFTVLNSCLAVCTCSDLPDILSGNFGIL